VNEENAEKIYCFECESEIEVDSEGQPIGLSCHNPDCPWGFQLEQDDRVRELHNLFIDDV